MAKKIFLPVLIIINIFFLINSAYSQEKANTAKYSVSFGTQFGFIYGQAFELVYALPGQTKNGVLSELIWDMKPVLYYGANIDFGRTDMMSKWGFYSSISFKAGIPMDSGVMEDRDWFENYTASPTRFSSHTNKTNEFYWIDALIGVSFPIRPAYVYLLPFISGSWMRFSFSGRDGYYIYKDSKKPIGTFNDDIISYKQDWFLAAGGVLIGTRALMPFTFDVSFKISPFTYCAAVDNHILRFMIFKDYTSKGLYFEPGCNVSFILNKLEFSLGFSYRHIGRTKGKSYYNENNGNFSLSPEKAGAGLSLYNTLFLVKLRI